MATVAILLVAWALTETWLGRRPQSGSDGLQSPPRFIVDLEEASQSELQLLPGVGPKTAASWMEVRSEDGWQPPQSEKDLEELPRVGPLRARQLAPHTIETRP